MDPTASARHANLRYVTPDTAGLTRHPAPGGFAYRTAAGRLVRAPRTLRRIQALAIPPAWTDVWICVDSNGHLQATGRDARGRKQYRYHSRWHAVRDDVKYGRLASFAAALPNLRRKVAAGLKAPDRSRERVLATVLRLLEATLIRVGNEEYARANRSFGLTTLLDQHAEVRGGRVRFKFKAKSGVRQTVDLHDPVLARTVKRCQELPGQVLFQYVDENGVRQRVESGDVNEYIREAAGEAFTAKDFRTWAGTVLAACALRDIGVPESATARKRHLVQAIDTVAARLGNTRAVCRRSYVHPVVLDAYMEGVTIPPCAVAPRGRHPINLTRNERAVLALLRKHQSRPATVRAA